MKAPPELNARWLLGANVAVTVTCMLPSDTRIRHPKMTADSNKRKWMDSNGLHECYGAAKNKVGSKPH